MASECPQDVVTGREGNVVCDEVRIARITNWTLTETSDETTWHDSDSGLFRQRLPSIKEAKGTFDFKFDTNFPIYDKLRAGECCELILYYTAELYWTIPVALITSLSFTVNIDTLAVEEGACDWASHNVYYAPGDAPAGHPLPDAPS